MAPITLEPSPKPSSSPLHLATSPGSTKAPSTPPFDEKTNAPITQAPVVSVEAAPLFGFVGNPAVNYIPQKRYIEWTALNNSDKMHAKNLLGYVKRTWNLLGTNDVEMWAYADLNEDEVAGVQGLGIDEEMWNCHINHYTGFWWADLMQMGHDQYYRVLGWSADSWENDAPPPDTENMLWDQLTPEQQQAATQVCYNRYMWNEVPLSQWQATLPTGGPSLSPVKQSTTPTSTPNTNVTQAPSKRTLMPSIAFNPAHPPLSPPTAAPMAEPSRKPSSSPSNSHSHKPSASPTEIETESPSKQSSSMPSTSFQQPIITQTNLPTETTSRSPPSESPTPEPLSASPTETLHNDMIISNGVNVGVANTPSANPTAWTLNSNENQTPSPSNLPTASPTITVTNHPSSKPTIASAVSASNSSALSIFSTAPVPPAGLLSPPYDDPSSHGIAINPATTNIPTRRFLVWSLLSDVDLVYATSNLGYNRVTWNNPGANEIETWSYHDLYDNELAGLEGLGIDGEMWDCHINHYGGYWWEDIELHGYDQYYGVLGWDISSWDLGGQQPDTEDFYWDDLTPEQQAAATQLCYHRDSWNMVPLAQWGV